MTLHRQGDGFVVDAELLAGIFDLDAADVQRLMREGAITSHCETGIDEDEGRWRLVFQHGNLACRLTVDVDGQILSRATYPVAGPQP
ncbi:hypothetical protein SAMN04487972_10285 [Paracoccus halophilus]|uniref:Uncharacterized protein n=1 Tax=Paracoccus halophilus TaxID=376733 RepID=A0A099F9F5_9RHOB|nr:DUF6522 family protein [Paracoccus halophilus]KGJ06851.1 hypothetical protein IT41_01375 [Paracoccus halophilus]SFA41120.1 hypothetical protein SAMN04487972_10285 [Paracoccus halophilus]